MNSLLFHWSLFTTNNEFTKKSSEITWCIRTPFVVVYVQNDVIIHKRHFATKLTRRVINTYYKTPLVIYKIDMKENICPCVITIFFKTKPSSINKPISLDGTSSRRTTCNETCKNIAKRNKILKCLDWLYFF